MRNREVDALAAVYQLILAKRNPLQKKPAGASSITDSTSARTDAQVKPEHRAKDTKSS